MTTNLQPTEARRASTSGLRLVAIASLLLWEYGAAAETWSYSRGTSNASGMTCPFKIAGVQMSCARVRDKFYPDLPAKNVRYYNTFGGGEDAAWCPEKRSCLLFHYGIGGGIGDTLYRTASTGALFRANKFRMTIYSQYVPPIFIFEFPGEHSPTCLAYRGWSRETAMRRCRRSGVGPADRADVR